MRVTFGQEFGPFKTAGAGKDDVPLWQLTSGPFDTGLHPDNPPANVYLPDGGKIRDLQWNSCVRTGGLFLCLVDLTVYSAAGWVMAGCEVIRHMHWGRPGDGGQGSTCCYGHTLDWAVPPGGIVALFVYGFGPTLGQAPFSGNPIEVQAVAGVEGRTIVPGWKGPADWERIKEGK